MNESTVDTRILILDEYPIYSAGLKRIITDRISDASIEEFMDENQILHEVEENNFDLIIVGSNMTNTSMITRILSVRPEARILVICDEPEIMAKHLLRIGVMGLIKKNSPEAEFSLALRNILDNKKYVSHDLIRRWAHGTINGNGDPFEQLTTRQFQVILSMLNGDSYSDISQKLNIRRSTVSAHKSRILKKMKCNSAGEVIEMVRQYHGALSQDFLRLNREYNN